MKRLIAAIAILAPLAFAAGCGKSSSDANEILIGEYSSLTGTTATFGTSTHRGILMAVDEVNQAGGVLGKKIKLLTEDTQSKPEEAALAATKLITRDNVVTLIGEIASSRSLAAAPICQKNKVPMVSPGSTNPEVTKKGDYIFRVCFIDPFQGEVIAKFAFNSLHLKRVAILSDVKNDYSVGLAQFFHNTFTQLGGEVIGEQSYSEGDNDFKAQLTALKATNPEAIFVPGYYTESALIVKQARELNMTIPFFGGDGWDSDRLIEIGGDAMNGTYFTNHYSADDTAKMVQDFVAKYRRLYENQTPDAMAVLGYDAAKIVFDAITRAGSTDRKAIRDALATTKDYPGVAGKTTIDADRNALKPAVVVAIEGGKQKWRETVQP
ncbi:MAG: ABC transporter substrate-binding protein [candidate division Zixibacteria bacterium]|nr:ABC transporter substrate-binding protein [candidate division Zixibacteria bacterium]